MPRALYRFTRDLRLSDHAGLAAAAAHGEIVPVLLIDRALDARLRTSPRRAAFYCAAVASLDASLRERGSQLLIRRGAPATTLKQLARETQADAILWCASYDRAGMERERALQSSLEESGLRAQAVHDAPAIPPEETTAARPSAGDGYRAFVPYFELWRELEPASYELPLLLRFADHALRSEPLPQPSEFGGDDGEFQVSEALTLAHLSAFLRSDGLQYAFALNAPADDRTSHLGADLTFGTVPARTVVREIRARMDDPFLLAEERTSLKLFLRSLAMRDFFLQLSWYHPQTDMQPLQEKMRAFHFARSHPALEAWRDGRTGYPLVDAGIRQLHATGWMHPRVRSVAASFLCFDLGVDWRAGIAEWDRYLIEDDYALAAGNWQWIAGVGADLAAYPRIFNPVKQSRHFDPDGVYVRRWIPELAHLRGPYGVRAPDAQMQFALYTEQPYPAPVVDHDIAARAFLDRYRKFT